MARKQQSISSHIKKQAMITSTGSQNKESRDLLDENAFLELPEAEYKSLIHRTLQDIRKEMRQYAEQAKEHTDEATEEIRKIIQEHNEKFNKLEKFIDRQQSEIQKINNKITELDNSIESQRHRIEQVEARISELEDKSFGTNTSEEKSDKRILKNEETLRIMWDCIKRNNLRVIGVPEQGGITENTEKIVEDLLAENFPDIVKDEKIPIQDAHQTPHKVDLKRKSPRHIIIKLAKTKDKETIIRAARNKRKVTYKGEPLRISSDYLAETMQARRQWVDIFKKLKERNCQPRIVYPSKLSLKYEGEIKTFPDKHKLREFIKTKPKLQEILKGVLELENQ
ncbi:guanine nucleotide-binding protein subunit beta-like protein 1 isoform X1 [Elephas maximus indicus]|uniref:guanine nucleotide-binding protein subunit beta-like protein 1 isoform X1 n=1 Tax=Elephas maximus indicus TaxID=99487 RepID=UPI002116D165|nr:guanine nucleotide-binding protein subunit beta-like protein 1 isoform X1 [Elephas maximus indicus]XP_049721780.1 guanine nucleotide-binding protein subunit beta-like protein 1 isoform X1 [Elephas maximus indicus]